MAERTSTLAGEIERCRADESSRQASLLGETLSWFERVRQFREQELDTMILRDSAPTERRLHRAFLAQIIAQGESLAVRSLLRGLPPNDKGITKDAIEAELESLLLTQDQWYSEMTEARKQQLFEEVFGDEKSEA